MARRNATTLPASVQEALTDTPDFLRDLHTALQEMLEAEMTEHVGAERHERTPERTGHRNGYKPRTLTKRVGTLTLKVPQDSEGTFSTKLFARYQRSEKSIACSSARTTRSSASPGDQAPDPCRAHLPQRRLGPAARHGLVRRDERGVDDQPTFSRYGTASRDARRRVLLSHNSHYPS